MVAVDVDVVVHHRILHANARNGVERHDRLDGGVLSRRGVGSLFGKRRDHSDLRRNVIVEEVGCLQVEQLLVPMAAASLT